MATYSTAISDNDRLNVMLSGTNITVYRNNVSVATTIDSFNQTATIHGIAVET